MILCVASDTASQAEGEEIKTPDKTLTYHQRQTREEVPIKFGVSVQHHHHHDSRIIRDTLVLEYTTTEFT